MLAPKVIFLVASLAFIGEVRGSLHLMPVMNETERYVNETFIVTCHGIRAKNTTWKGPSGLRISNNKGRVHVEERTRNEDIVASLIFERITREDKGNYTCMANINGENFQRSFKLIVIKPISFYGTPDEQNATEHQNALIRCEVTGYPNPTVVWQFKGKTLHGERYKVMPRGLYISNITHEDVGEYQCRAYQITSQTSKIAFVSINLNVLHKPVWRKRIHARWLGKNREAAYGYMGGLANLTCEAEAQPEAQFLWIRNKTIIGQEPNTNYTIISEPHRSVLQFPVTGNNVFGDYECTASNPLGRISKTIELQKGSKPRRPSYVNLSQVGAHWATFEILTRSIYASSSTGNSDGPDTQPLVEDPAAVIGYRIEFTVRHPNGSYSWANPEYQDVYTRDSDNSYSIVDLMESTEYVARVAARNMAGLGDYSPELRLTTKDSSTSSASIRSPFNVILISALLLFSYCS